MENLISALDLISRAQQGQKSETIWNDTGQIIIDNLHIFASVKNKDEMMSIFRSLFDNQARMEVPERGVNRKGKTIELRKINGEIKWSTWVVTARIFQNATEIFRGIEKSGFVKIFPEEVLISRSKLQKIINPDKLSSNEDSPFNNDKLRDWFFDISQPAGIFQNGVVVIGSGPFTEQNFKIFLNQKSIKTGGQEADFDTLIVGREFGGELLEFLEKRRERKLLIYSQEMLLAFLATYKDPREKKAICNTFMHGHPALEFIAEWGFPWPTTTVIPGKGILDPVNDWPAIGMLKHMGYQVGKEGVNSETRRKILWKIFTLKHLPNVQNCEYMEQWGDPETPQRLQKIANSIASFARSNKRKERPAIGAINEWVSDLEWLKKNIYYSRKFSFSWPVTSI